MRVGIFEKEDLLLNGKNWQGKGSSCWECHAIFFIMAMDPGGASPHSAAFLTDTFPHPVVASASRISQAARITKKRPMLPFDY